MNPDFNTVARPYDFISRLVFGDSLVEAQTSLLHYIPSNSQILIVGGGTGWILEEISKIHPAGLQIVYVEVSSTMIDLSKKRNYKQNSVSFIHQPVEDFLSETLFDVVITPFFFDLFLREKVDSLFSHIHDQLKINGLWLYTDFIPAKFQNRFWQKLLLKTMYIFFGFTSKVKAKELVDMDLYFQNRFIILKENWFYKRFIRSNIYKKRA